MWLQYSQRYISFSFLNKNYFQKKKKWKELDFRWIQKCVFLGNVNHWIFSGKFLHFSNTCNFIDHNLRRCSYKLCLFFLPSICKVCCRCFFKYILKILRSVAMIRHIDSIQSAFWKIYLFILVSGILFFSYDFSCWLAFECKIHVSSYFLTR